ncbi:uncharacterized protein [Argopecten irradians]|uniref:uncharacterized protein n=1 Tax=Argopecten irradians TaxID=31199 RepID=UPI003722D224
MVSRKSNIKTKILDRREVTTDITDSVDISTIQTTASDEEIHVYVGDQVHSKLFTVKKTTFKKVYIDEIHTTEQSDFRPGDELVKVDNEWFTETTTKNIKTHFSFDAETSDRRSKVLTIRRTEGGETSELDVEVVLVTNIISREHANRVYTRSPRRRPQLLTRNILLVREMTGTENAFIQTANDKYLTVRNGAVVGDWMGAHNMDDFSFDLVPMRAIYKTRYGRPKQAICCRIKWGTFWLKARVTDDGEVDMELTEDEADDHTTVFKRRVNSNGQGTGFECLLFKNVYLQYYPKRNEVDVKPYTTRVDMGKTLNAAPTSSLFRVFTRESSATNNTANFVSRTSTFKSYIGQCFGFFRRQTSNDMSDGTGVDRHG